MFKEIKGQEKAVDILRRAAENDKIANSYLFYGPDGVGKFTAALYFGMLINCHTTHKKRPCGSCTSCRKFLSFSHPDLLYIFPTPNLKISPDGQIKSEKVLAEYEAYISNKIETPWKEFLFSGNTEIRIDSIRMLEHRINLSPNEGVKKIYIIEDADKINQKAANAFLKTLEEPPNDTVIILTTSKPNALLPTIISRCQQVQFRPLPRSLIEAELSAKEFINEADVKMFSRIANGSLEKALQIAQAKSGETRSQILAFLQILKKQDDVKFIDFSENYKSIKDKNKLNELITHLINWISDIAFYQSNPEELINLDHPEIAEFFYQQNPAVDTYAAKLVTKFDDLKTKLNNNNVNPQLILIKIYNELCDTFFKGAR